MLFFLLVNLCLFQKPMGNIIDDDDENYQAPYMGMSCNDDFANNCSKVMLAVINYKCNVHHEFKRLRALKNWTLPKSIEFDRFVRNILNSRGTSSSTTCWNELIREVNELIELKMLAEAKIKQLETKIIGDIEVGEEDVAISAPVTAQKVNRSLKTDFDEEKLQNLDVHNFKLKASLEGNVQDKVVGRNAKNEYDVIAIEDVGGTRHENHRRLSLPREAGTDAY